MSLNTRVKVVTLLALPLIVGSWFLVGCGSSSTVGIEDGPGVLYFYAEW
jgi:hypothetical protein